MYAPAAQPQRTASRSEAPSASATAKAEQNASPAPVVSTARAGKAGTTSSPIRAPWSPSVTTNVAARAPDRPRLGLVRHDVVGDGRDRLRGRRGRVQHRADTRGAADRQRVQRGLDRDLQLDEQDVGGLDLRRETVHVRPA